MDTYQNILIFIKQDLSQLQQDILEGFNYDLEQNQVFQNIHRNLVNLENKIEQKNSPRNDCTIEYSISARKPTLSRIADQDVDQQQTYQQNLYQEQFQQQQENDDDSYFSQHQKLLSEYKQSIQNLKSQNKMIKQIVEKEQESVNQNSSVNDQNQSNADLRNTNSNIPRLFEEQRNENKRNLEQLEKEIQEFIPKNEDPKNHNIFQHTNTSHKQNQQRNTKQKKYSNKQRNNINNNMEDVEYEQQQINEQKLKLKQMIKAKKHTNVLSHEIDSLDQEINLITNTIQDMVLDN